MILDPRSQQIPALLSSVIFVSLSNDLESGTERMLACVMLSHGGATDFGKPARTRLLLHKLCITPDLEEFKWIRGDAFMVPYTNGVHVRRS